MKTKEYTKEQLQAINSRGCSMIVSAAAGSGKTSVLVERLVQMLSCSDNGLYADRIIVSTFTKNAAAEMKQRLISAINERIDAYPENTWLIRQHSLLQNAKISTIHSFCFDLIRDNVDVLNISAGFKIMEDTEERILCIKAVSEAIEDSYTEDFEEMTYLSESLCDKTDERLEEIIYNLYKFLMSVPFFDDWIQTTTIDYYATSDISHDIALDFLFTTKVNQLNDCLSMINMAMELCEQAEDDRCMNVISKDYRDIKNFINILQSYNRCSVKMLEIMASYRFERFSSNKDNEYKETISALRDNYKNLFDDPKSNSKISFKSLIDIIEHYHEDKTTNERISKVLYKLICNVHTKVVELKSEENALGFSDAERLAIQLLATKDSNGMIVKTELAKSLSEYYQTILIDEFQDSNNNQDLIFKMLSKGGTANRMGTNVFVVGDIKQSIYNFRLANPDNFNAAMRIAEPYTDDHPSINSKVLLNRNFRSSSDVIDFVNYVFKNIMTLEVGQVDYDYNEELIYGSTYPKGDRRTQIALINPERYTESEYIANTIKSMIDNACTVVEHDGTKRRCRPSDFCLLFMSIKNASEYFEKLQEVGLNANFDQGEEFLKSREISLLFNMVKIVSNPTDNIALTSIMMSPIYMFTPDDIATIRLINRNSSIYSSVLEISKSVDKTIYSKKLISKVDALLNDLSTLRSLSANCTTYELMTNIIDLTDLISVMQVYDTSDTRRNNIQVFLKIAQNHDSTSTTGITGFIRYINNILELRQDINVKTNISFGDCIEIKTIHKSKGLEYPFIFLCDTKRQFNTKDLTENLQTNFKYGLSYRLKDRSSLTSYDTADSLMMINLKKSELLSERMRLMYVALTRAKERLFIPLTISATKANVSKVSTYINVIEHEGKIPTYLVKNVRSMQEWIIMVLCACKNASALNRYLGLPNYGSLPCDASIDVFEYNPNANTSMDATEPSRNTQYNVIESLKNIVQEYCEFTYTNPKADLPARISVSNIVKFENVSIAEKVVKTDKCGTCSQDSNSIEDLRTPKFMLDTALTPAERGSAVHKVLQHCNFKRLQLSIEEEINNLLKHGYITNEQMNAMDLNTFKRFIDSEIFPTIIENPVQRERDFLVKISDLKLDEPSLDIYKDTDTMLQGTIDMLVFEPDGITLIDYKTDNIHSMDILRQRYSLQLRLYRSALELIENSFIKHTLIYSTRLGKTIEIK